MSITKELATCESKAGVEKLWKAHKITAYPEKTKMLRECMGNPMTFYLPGKKIDAASEYEVELEIFLLGEWRIIDLYKKAGIKNEKRLRY
jgi:hypothetical protein